MIGIERSFDRRPQLGVLIQEGLDDDIAAEASALFSAEGLDLDLRRHRGGPYASFELYLPTVLGLFVASSYFGGFLKKAGEDHYSALKDGAVWLWRKAAYLPLMRRASRGKSEGSPYSLSYSITGEIAEGVRFKFVIETEIEADIAAEAIAAFLDIIKAIHDGSLPESVFDALLNYQPIGGTVILRYDAPTGTIVPIDSLAGRRPTALSE